MSTNGTSEATLPADLGLVSARRLIDPPAEITFRLSPGDRALVAAGETVVAGAPIAERLRDPVLMDRVVPASAGSAARRARRTTVSCCSPGGIDGASPAVRSRRRSTAR